MPSRRLADELADLFTPVPYELDPEAHGINEAAQLRDVPDEDFGARTKPSKQAREKGLQLRGDIALDDAAYRGRKTSRAKVFGGDDDDNAHQDDQHCFMNGGQSASDDDDEQLSQDGLELAGSSSHDEDDDANVDDGFDAEDGDIDGVESEEEEPNNDRQAGSRSQCAQHDASKQSRHKGGSTKGQQSNDDGNDDLLDDDDKDDDQGSSDDEGMPTTTGLEAGDEDLAVLEREYEQVQAEDAEAMVTLRQKSEKERSKAQAVQNQQTLYEKSLEMRILLQRALQGSQRLPRPETHAAIMAKAAAATGTAAAGSVSELRERFSALQAAVQDTLQGLLDVQEALLSRNPVAGAVQATAGGVKRRRDDGAAEANGDYAPGPTSTSSQDVWSRIDGCYACLVPFRDAALDRWHRRTVLSSGSAALRNNLRALNQSISNQVSALMRDPSKFVQRTQLPVVLRPRPLCEEADEATTATTTAAQPGPTFSTSGAEVAQVAVDEEVRDSETFDDSEFYQQLLKEFLERSGSGAGAAAAVARGPKRRKTVDRRASKGRKIRYHIQEKLVNFMVPTVQEAPSFAAQLFANLFGHAGH